MKKTSLLIIFIIFNLLIFYLSISRNNPDIFNTEDKYLIPIEKIEIDSINDYLLKNIDSCKILINKIQKQKNKIRYNKKKIKRKEQKIKDIIRERLKRKKNSVIQYIKFNRQIYLE